MTNDWRRSTWGEEITLEYGKAIRGYSTTHGNYRVFGSNGPIGWTSEALAQGPGVILGRKGAYRGVEYWPDPFWVIDTAYYLRPKTALHMRWLYYAVKHYRLGEIDDGSPIPSTTRAAVYMLDLKVPPQTEQQAIAHILGTLDDKIELNHRRNETLAAIAHNLFHDWFLDFGPVRAKMEGSAPYLPAEVWEAFPDELDEAGKPEGWAMQPLDEIADFLNGLALQKFPATDLANSLPVIKIAELRNGVSARSDRASRSVPANYIIKDGDFLFSWSGSLLAKFWTGGEGALNQHLFRVTSNDYPIWFVSHWVYHHLKEFQAIAASKATTMGHIQRSHLSAAMTLCPPGSVLEKLEIVMSPLVQQAIHNDLESRTLAQLRDTLLPKLISGQLRIPDAEAFLKEHC